jgi:hypothetical protein
MPEKNSADKRVGGPGAAHENRKAPEKSKPHGQLDREDARSGAHHLRGVSRSGQDKPYAEAQPFTVEHERSRADAGATRGQQHAGEAPNRSASDVGHTAKDTDLIHPRDRKQVR